MRTGTLSAFAQYSLLDLGESPPLNRHSTDFLTESKNKGKWSLKKKKKLWHFYFTNQLPFAAQNYFIFHCIFSKLKDETVSRYILNGKWDCRNSDAHVDCPQSSFTNPIPKPHTWVCQGDLLKKYQLPCRNLRLSLILFLHHEKN